MLKKKPTKPKLDFVLRALLSLIFAFLLWAFAITNTDPIITETYDSVPITFQNADTLTSNGLIYESSVNSISVKLYGRTLQISKISASDIYAVVDLSSLSSAGSYSVEVSIKGIGDNISVVDISPQYISITVSELTTESQDYSIELSGDAASGYDVIGYSSDVDAVEVSGSATMLASIATIKGTIDIQDQDTDFTSTVTLQAYDEDENLLDQVTLYPQEVDVSVNIGQLKTVPVSIQTSGTCATGYTVTSTSASPDEVTVIIDGDVTSYDSVTAIDTKAVDISNCSATFTSSVDLLFADGVYAKDTSTVSAKITIEETARETYTYDSIQVRNIPSGMTCTFPSFSNLTLTVTGEETALSSLSEDDITVYIDLSEYTSAGTYEPTISVTLPDGITLVDISSDTVTVVLSKD
jgi:YbbR domain-containing protein